MGGEGKEKVKAGELSDERRTAGGKRGMGRGGGGGRLCICFWGCQNERDHAYLAGGEVGAVRWSDQLGVEGDIRGPVRKGRGGEVKRDGQGKDGVEIRAGQGL